ncbi:hypothetical protein BDN72DRAFT_839394 [Pluteus cervinus]|uniref:Uncharacterized protein n=1 Tax=Pluteus cervinus TaxID=181527 RepID=A0ACD3AXC3_9AGAR|nr:hypothetical protein BDN72DRAFT_839394 [Pluteus cervinus]
MRRRCYLALVKQTPTKNNTDQTLSFNILPLSRGIPTQSHPNAAYIPIRPATHDSGGIEPLETSKPFPFLDVYVDSHSLGKAVSAPATERISGDATVLSGPSGLRLTMLRLQGFPPKEPKSEAGVTSIQITSDNKHGTTLTETHTYSGPTAFDSGHSEGDDDHFVLPITDISYDLSSEGDNFAEPSELLEDEAYLKQLIKEANATNMQRV